ncbi:AAA family ATPase [Omnitrophica bacterium]|nr:AAA family ATPase [Candidatus Omnitrophota bacterium]
MENIPRRLKIKLPAKRSAFLWGARKTGKSTYLKEHFPKSLKIDFLRTDTFFEYTKRPALLRERLLDQKALASKAPVILDEVQKVPQILDEIQSLIEDFGLSFILCGSSARKLKRGQANLLGGRAWRYEMFPFVSAELKELNLMQALNRGLIPEHYLDSNYHKSQQAYIQDYLKEEVFDEGLTRNIPAFSRFFDALGFSHGEMINCSNIARDCGVDAKTVREYFQILEDTMLGRMVSPFKKRQNRQVISKAPKFYLFDVGIAGRLCQRRISDAKGELFGKAFEHFIFMELAAYRSYSDLDFPIEYWRTKTGLEVDFVLGRGEVAVEVKGTSRVDPNDLRSVKAFIEEYSPKKTYVVCNEPEARLVGKIRLVPWRIFLKELWQGKVLS